MAMQAGQSALGQAAGEAGGGGGRKHADCRSGRVLHVRYKTQSQLRSGYENSTLLRWSLQRLLRQIQKQIVGLKSLAHHRNQEIQKIVQNTGPGAGWHAMVEKLASRQTRHRVVSR